MQSAAAPPGPPAVETHEALERAVKLRRPSPWGWIIAATCVVCLLIIIGKVVIDRSRKNLRRSEIVLELESEPNGLAMLSDRHTGAGYSFRLPKGFVATHRPEIGKLPPGTTSYSWRPAEDSEEAGSEFKIWVMPVELNIHEALREMDSMGARLDYHAAVKQKSTHRRIGEDFIAVVARLEGSDHRVPRNGNLHVIYDCEHGNTLMIVGMGVGRMHREVQFMLDQAALTIRYEGS